MTNAKRRIAVTSGGEYVPGLNAVLMGVTRATRELGWEVVGLRDGYEGLLFPQRYPNGGLLALTPELVDRVADAASSLLGTSRLDPLRVQQLTDDGQRDEADRSADLLDALHREGIDGVVPIVSAKALSIALKLERRGFGSVCVPKSIENDIASTEVTIGFSTALSFCTELLDRVRAGARASHQIAVVEVPGEAVGWLALQSGIAAGADVVLVPEIPFDLEKVAAHLASHEHDGQTPSLIVAAEGARLTGNAPLTREQADHRERLRRALSPGSSGDDTDGGRRVIEKAGLVGKAVARAVQHRSGHKAFSVTANQLLQGGTPNVTDRQLGLAYGAAAVRGIHAGKTGTMTAIRSAAFSYVPLVDAVNQARRVRPDSEFLLAARALGICLGD